MKSISKLTMALAFVAAVLSTTNSSQSAHALPTKTLYSFCSQPNCTDGFNPAGALVQGTDGHLYGTTDGGAKGGGTIFTITSGGALTTLYGFCSEVNSNGACVDGEYPAGLIQTSNGDFYGTTQQGGTYSFGFTAFGTVFKLAPGGTLTTLFDFDASDGNNPVGALVPGPDGYLYGSTWQGGGGTYGTIFKISLSGAQTMLHGFCSEMNVNGYCADGGFPAALILASGGDFYGTTQIGGTNNNGTVFKMTAAGKLTTLYSFCAQTNCTDGATPLAALVQGTDGAFYGTTVQGGNGYGTVFKITSGGILTTLHSFDNSDGAYPYAAALIQATDGNFYGTTEEGGAYHAGTVFQMTPAGSLAKLHSFCAENICLDGANPVEALVQATNGDFYGTTPNGGANGLGAVFSLSIGLGPFVETQTTSGIVGAAVNILGTDLTGATDVMFNGTSATFTVVKATEIIATVPAGATTGFIQVGTPGGTLTSGQTFDVTP